MYLFQLASQHGTWLSARQSATATNVANADTPGYKAMDVTPFQAVFDQAELQVAMTHPSHMTLSTGDAGRFTQVQEAAEDASMSGNDVSLETELAKAGDIGRMQALDTGLTRIFQRMILSSLKA